MSQFDFCIPLCLGDLVKTGAINQYVVQDVLSPKQLAGHVQSFKAALKSQGPLCILEHFDTAYSVLQHFQTADSAVKADTLDILLKVVSGLSASLPALLDSSSLSPADRKLQLNTVKMGVFLLCKLAEGLESDSSRHSIITAPSKGGKKSRTANADAPFQWDTERDHVLQALTQLLQLDIRTLWSLSLVEEEFTSCVTRCCYKLLENPAINQVKYKSTREAIIHLLGLLVKKYNHLLGASVKVIQLLQHFEHLSSVFAQAMSVWGSEYGVKAIVGEVIREIGQKSSEELSREGSGVRSYAAFLSELGTLVPEAMVPNISVLLQHLEGECYSMRLAVCEVLGEILVRVLHGDQLSETSRAARDQFLDTLQEHVHDANAFVRSRVLQVFTRVVQSKALPLVRYREVLTLAVGRLIDKSVNVCKNAIQLLAAFIANNPYSCKLSSVDLKAPLEKEVAKLKELKEKEREKAPVAVIEAWEVWQAMEPELLQTVQAELDRRSQEDETEEQNETEEEIQPGGSPRDTAVRIAQLLQSNKYRQAVGLTLKGLSAFPESDYFSADSPLTADGIMGTLGRIFKGSEEDSGKQEPVTVVADKREEGSEEEREEASSELKKQEMLVQYLRDTESFSLQIEEAISLITSMLYWKTTSVVQEAIQFCVTVCEFGVSQSLNGVRRMLPLVWSPDTAVREATVEAYKRLYLRPPGDTLRAKAQTLVHNLSVLMVDASLGTIQCLEEIVLEFFQKSELQSTVIQVLWERFTGKTACSGLERRAAVLLLGMAARAEKEVVLSNLDTLVSVALGEKVMEDFLLARDACIAVSKITDKNKTQQRKDGRPFRLPQDHQLFTALTDAITAGVLLSDAYWVSFMEQAVSLIYQLSESPDKTCAHILRSCTKRLLDEITQGGGSKEEEDTLEHGSQDNSDPCSQSYQVQCGALAQLLSLAGSVAFQQLEHLERSVSGELRRRRMEKEEKQSAPDRTPMHSSNETTVEEEMGLTGASAEDTEAELIRKICETELLHEETVLTPFLPLMVKVCSNPGRYSHPQLSTAACLALAKYMMISSSVCDSNLRLLFTMLEKASLPSVRSNTIIALGDLTIRFPNLIEPWTPHLYARLSDQCPSVRLTALTVLTHLVLKDMVKVKGQVSEMALLLIDPESKISSLALNFFNELAGKDNAIYNLLPDIISRLSDPERGIAEEDFQTIMKQLFSYITKEKQTESLVEKLCQRFRTAKSERQWRDLSHCLSLLSLSERGFKKLQECWECYSDKLSEEGVYQGLLALVGKLRRAAKPEVKAQVEEFEKRLTAVHTRGLENVETEEGDGGSQTTKTPAATRKTDRKPTRGKSRTLTAQNDDKDDFCTPKTKTRRVPRKKPTISFSSDEEEEESAAELSENETPKVTTPILRSARRSRTRR
ncbi:condensin complex subunit 1 [Lepisosteus oculatus]|uniref:condensin complex subunit 1 n=1 Tax=Lepisosteus oculatus TaxID=7918 RepID=UPI003713CB1F